MKLPLHHSSPHHRGRSGSAVIVVMALLTIILIYVAANLRTLYVLGGELRLLERRQVQRLEKAGQGTNAPAVARAATSAIPVGPNKSNQ
jgi:hypothetical protein